MQEIIIGKNEAGQRLDKYLGKFFKDASPSFIYKMLRKKNIELNSRKATGKEKLIQGDSVKLFLADDTIAKFRGTDLCKKSSNKNNQSVSLDKDHIKLVSSNIVFENDDVLFVNKPAGILSQKAAGTDISINEMIIDYLLDNNFITIDEMSTFKPSVCNRLDRNTTGLISFGKTLAGVQALSLGFKERTFDKYYLAVVWGRITCKKNIEGYLTKDTVHNKVIISKESTPDSSLIKTEFEPLKNGRITVNGNEKDITLLKIKLITGKTHQIRAHLSSIGNGIIGDDKYGNKTLNAGLKKEYGIKFQMLHSWQLHFGQVMEYDVLKPLENVILTAKPSNLYETLFS